MMYENGNEIKSIHIIGHQIDHFPWCRFTKRCFAKPQRLKTNNIDIVVSYMQWLVKVSYRTCISKVSQFEIIQSYATRTLTALKMDLKN